MTTDGPRASSRSGGSRSSTGDPALIVAARAGDGAAFQVLRHRHEAAALRLATILVGPGEPAEALSRQAFDQVRRTLESGGGPDCAFRLQILRDVRSAATGAAPINAAPITAAPIGAAPTVEEQPSGDGVAAAPAARADADPIVRQSFLSLPERWGSVLWHTDVEHQSDAEVGMLLGMRTSTVTTLAARSRDGLVRGYLAGQVHQLDDPACAQVLGQLRRTAKGGAGTPQDPAVQEHLDGCDGCRTAAQTLTVLTGDLGAVLAIVVLGGQGIPYLEAVEAAAGGLVTAAAPVPARPRSMRLVLVAVALVAVTAAVPALRAGAGSDADQVPPAAAALENSVAPVAQSAGTIGGGAVPGLVPETEVSSTANTAVPPGTTGSAIPTTGRATITTTGVNGLPTRVDVSTMTSIGVDGVPTTVAVIPGVSGSPATTVTGSIPAGTRPSGLPDFSTYNPGAATTTGPASTSTGGWPAVPPIPGMPPVFGATTPPQTTAPALPAATAPRPTGTGTTGQGATATPTTATTSATSTSTAVQNPPPGNPDPTTPSDEPTTDPTTDEPTTDEPTGPTTSEPTTSEPTSEADPEPDVIVQTPPTLVAFLPLLRTVPTLFTISNQTGAAIHEQTLTVSLPQGISASSIGVDGSPGACESTGAGTFSCEIPALSEDDRSRMVTLTLSAADDAVSGDIVVSVTGHQQTGRISVLL